MTSAPGEAPALEGPAVSAAGPRLGSSSEPRATRLARLTRDARLYASAGVFVALIVVLVILASENTRPAKLDWVVGSTRASLSWIILAAAVFGWLLGITTAVVVRRRTRRTSRSR
jgi:uncharacterized integral membrane protein